MLPTGPALFLGLSLVLSTVYMAFLYRADHQGSHFFATLDVGLQEVRLGLFLNWIDSGSMRRAWALRLAVISLGLGVAALPLPFLQLGEERRWWILAALLGLLLAAALVEGVVYAIGRHRRRKGQEAPNPEPRDPMPAPPSPSR